MSFALKMQVGVFQRERRGKAEEGLGVIPGATRLRRREGADGRPRRLLAVKGPWLRWPGWLAGLKVLPVEGVTPGGWLR